MVYVCIHREGNGNPLWYSCWENSMGGGAWQAAVHGVAKSRTQHHFHFSLSCIGEGNGNPVQCSCLENPRNGGAWWAAVYGVAQCQTRLKRLSSSSKRLTDNHYCIYYCGKESLRRNGVALIVNKRVRNAVFGCSLKNDRMISVSKANHSISQ